MFFIGWIALTATGIIASIVVFIWAIRTGQFSDQGRARYLPLADGVTHAEDDHQPARRAESYAMIVIIAIGLAAMISAVIMTILRVHSL
jgi:nitrogen fixation-related uncharacterized protein